VVMTTIEVLLALWVLGVGLHIGGLSSLADLRPERLVRVDSDQGHRGA
jgi:hypothetical protein